MRYTTCPDCRGERGAGGVACPTCDGAGEVAYCETEAELERMKQATARFSDAGRLTPAQAEAFIGFVGIAQAMERGAADVCPCTRGMQRAVVATSTIDHGRDVFLWVTGGIKLDAGEAGIDAGDLFPAHALPDEGFYIWEGNIVFSSGYHSPSGYSEPECEYVGEFRDPTDEEWTAIKEQRNPWPCALCSGSGLALVKAAKE